MTEPFFIWCILTMMLKTIAATILLAASATSQSRQVKEPRFEDYAVDEAFVGPPAEPVLATPVERRYRTRIRNAVMSGDSWGGTWKNPIKLHGPNFAGHYFVLSWGCGSDCVSMVVVNGTTGHVIMPPLRYGTELELPLDPLSDREMDFKPSSALMVLRNACHGGRLECGVYYFVLENDEWRLIRRNLVDLTKR